MIDINTLRKNPENPRTIGDEAFNKLKAKIKDFPEMLAKRPIVYDSTQGNMILGGNRRYDAIMALLATNEIVLKPEYFADAKDWTAAQKRKFIVMDNISDGEWDFEKLANQYEAPELLEWGLTLPMDITADPNGMGENFSLPNGEKSPLEQMTFTLAAAQASTVKEALDAIKDIPADDMLGNENSNGNKLYIICKQWLAQNK